MAGYLSPFRDELERMVGRNKHDLLERATFFWRMTHYVIARYRKPHPDWLFVRHEDLSLDPLVRFGPIFKFLGLNYTPKVKRILEEHTKPGNPIERVNEFE